MQPLHAQKHKVFYLHLKFNPHSLLGLSPVNNFLVYFITGIVI